MAYVFTSFSSNRLPGEFSVYVYIQWCAQAVSQFVWADDLPGSVIYHIWANPCILQYALSNKRSLGGDGCIQWQIMNNAPQPSCLFSVWMIRLMLASIGTVVSCYSCYQSVCHLRSVDAGCSSRGFDEEGRRVFRSRYTKEEVIERCWWMRRY